MGAVLELKERVHASLEEYAAACVKGDAATALQHAREAGRRERSLRKAADAAQLPAESVEQELTLAVVVSLAHAFALNKQYGQAENAYAAILKSGRFAQSPWLRVNLGNVYYAQQQYAQAVKQYRMALDQVPPTMKGMRMLLAYGHK